MRLRQLIWFSIVTIQICCKNQEPANSGQKPAGCLIPQKITAIYKDHVFDLSGYADEGKGDPFNLFDENALVDPRNDRGSTEDYLPVTNPQPTNSPQIYFPTKVGNRIVADLQITYKLSEVYVYDRSRTMDSVWIYTGDIARWKLKIAFTTSNETGSAGWRKFLIDDSSRFVMIRFSSWESNITEMVLYGCTGGVPPAPPSGIYAGERLPKKRMSDFLGVNYVMENEPKWVAPFHHQRLYSFALDFDNDTTGVWPDIKFNMLHYGKWDSAAGAYHFQIDDLQKINNGNLWFSLMGGSKLLAKQGDDHLNRPLTLHGMDSEDPLSYARHATLMWHLAAFFGHHKVEPGLLSLSNKPAVSGRGNMTVFENGNETDAYWIGNKYCTPMEYFALSSADFDGHESKLGKKAGITNADPGAKLMTSGLIELDTNRIKLYKFLCDNLRSDRAFVWNGGIQYHHYSNRDGKGITPEDDSLRWRLSKVRNFTYLIQPGVECILGENGYDRNVFSGQSAPAVPGLTQAQSQGIFILRSINATAFAGFDAYILFWLRTGEPEDNRQRFMTSGIIGPGSDGKTTAYPAWYYISTFIHYLGNYQADTILSEKGNVWEYKYRNVDHPDSVAYFIYCSSHNGRRISGFPLKLGKVMNDEATEVELRDNNIEGNTRTRQTRGDTIDLTVDERPKIILTREAK